MPCTTVAFEKMAEQGWTQKEIDLLKAEIELARREAEAKSFAGGQTRSQQTAAMRAAEKTARDVAHDRHHARLEQWNKELNMLAEFKRQHPGEHYDEAARQEALTIVGPGGHKHLGR